MAPITNQPQLKASMFGRMPVGGAKPKGGGKPAGPRGVRVEHRIGAQAPAEAIWAVIQDLDGWSRWNPLFPKAQGAIRIGAPIDIDMALPGAKPQSLQVTVLDWAPNEQLHLKSTALGGLVKVVHYIEIEQLAEASCIVSNGQIIGGLLGASAARQVGARLHRGLRQMNEALKAEAEAGGARRSEPRI